MICQITIVAGGTSFTILPRLPTAQRYAALKDMIHYFLKRLVDVSGTNLKTVTNFHLFHVLLHTGPGKLPFRKCTRHNAWELPRLDRRNGSHYIFGMDCNTLPESHLWGKWRQLTFSRITNSLSNNIAGNIGWQRLAQEHSNSSYLEKPLLVAYQLRGILGPSHWIWACFGWRSRQFHSHAYT